jgi:teichuronic acid biosynthesis protein TuaE
MASSFQDAFQFLSADAQGGSSAGVRQQLLRNGAEELRSTGGWGVGAGGSLTVQEKRGTVQGVKSMHNFWFEIIVEAGIVVGGLFMLWYAGMFLRMVQVARRSRDAELRRIARAAAITLLGFSVAAVSASSTIYLFPMWILLGTCTAVLSAHQRFVGASPAASHQ